MGALVAYTSYDGKGEKLDSLLSALNACKPLITETNRQAALQTILSKLDGKARAAVTNNPASIDEIINKLKEKCTQNNSIIAKLNALKQKENLVKFTEEVEKLTLDLEKAYIAEDVPLETATKLATSAGIKALTSGIKNEATKLLLKAGQFDTLSKAVEKATENEAERSANNTNTNSVLHYNKRNDNRNSRGRGSFHQNNNRYYNHSNNNGCNNNNYNNNRNSNGQRNNWNNNQRRGSSNYHQNNNRYQGNRQRGTNVYFLTPENQLVPQQVPVGGEQNVQNQNQNTQQRQPQEQSQYQLAIANVQRNRQ